MFKLFPANATKKPLEKGWQQQATDNRIVMDSWPTLYGDNFKLFGIPTGKQNNIMVLDVDVDVTKGENGWNTINAMGLEIPKTLTQKTPRGGQHFIYRYNPEKDPGNKVKFLHGLDIRSEGGYICYYGFEDINVPIVDAPEWIYEHTKPKYQANPELPQNAISLAPEIAQGIFAGALNAVRTAPAGESNHTLNIESFKVGQLVGCQAVTRPYAEAELFKAAKDRGKPDYEARATIRSGLDGGSKSPLVCPFNEPQVILDLPPPPAPPARWTPPKTTKEELFNRSKLRKPQLFKDWSTEDIALLFADGGVGKTTLSLNEAVCLALGDRFLGFNCEQPGGRTLFITGEDTTEKLKAMLGKILEQMGLLDGTPENDAKVEIVMNSIYFKKDLDLCLITKDRGSGFYVPYELAANKISQAIEDIRPKMVIFDPISSFWGSEQALNEMARAVTKMFSQMVEKYECCIEMINHVGKISSNAKDMTQFAGRGGTGLPSHSRVVKGLIYINAQEYLNLTQQVLPEGCSAMKCMISKFSDGSPMLNKEFIILRRGYLFERVDCNISSTAEDKGITDIELVFNVIRDERNAGHWASRAIIQGLLKLKGSNLSKAKVDSAVIMLIHSGYNGYKFEEVDGPLTNMGKVIIIKDNDGNELTSVP